jgi:hypothetical protein
MIKRRWAVWMLAGLLILGLGLAACGDDGDNGDNGDAAANGGDDATPADSVPDLGGDSPSLDMGGGSNGAGDGGNGSSGVIGCDDDSDGGVCPPALYSGAIDSTVTADGVSVPYASVYFAEIDAGDNLIALQSSENNNYEERATFTAYFAEADSVDAVLRDLDDPSVHTWEGEQLSGKYGLVQDMDADPPLHTAVGAAPLDDGRVLVLRMEVTGKYGWDTHYEMYEAMLKGITVE